jgi:hypothetical protein
MEALFCALGSSKCVEEEKGRIGMTCELYKILKFGQSLFRSWWDSRDR